MSSEITLTSCTYDATYYVSSVKYNEAYWSLAITPVRQANGLTKLKWKMQTAGSPGTNYTSECWVQFHQPHEGQEIKRFFDRTVTSNFNYDFSQSGEFTINHNNNGTATFRLYIVSKFQDGGYYTSTRAFELPINLPSTKCLPPDVVEAYRLVGSEAIQSLYHIPGEKIKIVWSGASAGTGESQIKGYILNYKIDQIQETVELDGKETTFYSFDIPKEAARGAGIQIIIKTKSTLGSEYDSEEVSYVVAYVNQLPKSPQVNISNSTTVLSSFSSGTILKAYRLTEDTDKQTHILQYKSGEAEWTDVDTLKIEFSINSSITYTFRVSDGLEYSNEVKRIFIKNSKPTIEEVSISGTLLNSNNKPSNSSYIVSPTIAVTNGDNGQNDNTYTFVLYTKENSTDAYQKTYTFSQKSNVLVIKDVRYYKSPTTSNGYYYKIEVTRNDSIENSDVVSSNECYITKIPQVDFSNDKISSSDTHINGTSFYFSNYITATINGNDAGYNKIIVEYNGKEENYQVSNYQTRLTLPNFPRGATLSLKTKPAFSNFVPIIPVNELQEKECIRILTTNLSNISVSSILNPYAPSTADLSFNNTIKSTKYVEYGFNEARFILNIRASYGEDFKEKNLEVEMDIGDTLSVGLTEDIIKNLFTDLGVDVNKPSSSEVKLTLSISNAYGDTYSGTGTCQICFVDENTEPQIGDLDFSVLNNTESTSIWTENCKFKINSLELTRAYHNISKVQITGLNGAINQTYSTIQGDSTDGKVELTDLSEVITGKIITDITAPTITITVVNAAGQSVTTTKNISGYTVYGLTEGTTIIQNSSWEVVKENETNIEKIDIDIALSNIGFTYSDGTFSAQVQKKTSSGFVDFTDLYIDNASSGYIVKDVKPFASSSNLYSGEFKLNNTSEYGEGFQVVRIKCTSTVGAATKIWYTQEFTIYKSSPTLSYRKNKVGINYSFPDNSLVEPSFVVGSHTGAQYIYFYHPDNTIEIDMSTGRLNSAVVDCGTWGQITGDITIGTPTFPGDLADIAYSGDIKHLLQSDGKNPVIILSGGSL